MERARRDVWIDDEKLSKQTPIEYLTLPLGKHKVRVSNLYYYSDNFEIMVTPEIQNIEVPFREKEIFMTASALKYGNKERR